MANYPSDGVNHRRQRRSSTPSANRYLPVLLFAPMVGAFLGLIGAVSTSREPDQVARPT
jgi:ABC-type enterobactin transport system permease subunit